MPPSSHILFIFLSFLLSRTTMVILCLNQEGLDLLQVKSTWTDPTGILSSWNNNDQTPCNWTGITCHQTILTVISINLSSASLSGPFDTTFICRLPSLTTISLHDNNLNSTIPISISKCQNLTYLDLSLNYIHGVLPSTLTTIPNLVYLDLQENDLSGEIPSTFGSFPRLQTLNLTNNLLTGPFPAFLANVTSLVELVLAYNSFDHGPIPPELGNLSNIQHLWLSSCGFVGTIPDTFSKLHKLANLELSYNSLTGEFPAIVFQIKNLYQLELYNNSFHGELPKKEWASMTQLRRIDLSINGFTGTIPVELCKLPLSSLCLADNNLHGLIPESLARSPNLYDLRLFGNSLTGLLPSDLGKNSPLQTLDVSYNKLFGELPLTLCENRELIDLDLIGNSFSGEIPTSLGECKSLRRIRVSENKFSGQVPLEIWGLPHVYLLDLAQNLFSGNLSNMISGGVNLSSISISGNTFSGSLPNEIGSLINLVEFYASDNKLIGEIPESLFKLDHLGTLDLSQNNLSGQISEKIESLKELNELNLANNKFTGEIPNEIGNLPVLNYLDLSGNLFYGKIPSGLGNLILNKLNLSNNQLSGEIPSEYSKPVYRDSFLGNPGLCGGFSHGCVEENPKKSNHNLWLLRFIFIFAGLVLVIGVVWFVFKYHKIKKSNDEGVSISKWRSFHKLGFSEFEIVQLLNEDNVIGSGASGKVYKAILSNGEPVAVKKLWERQSKKKDDLDLQKDEFDSEVETLGKIRHKNIVKLWCCFKSGNSKLLVYEYMPNGSLGDLLHSNKGRFLEWSMRLKIIVDAAEGLSYLHHDCVPPIIHRDVKSNNILLDEEYGARIADFGVAKFINVASQGSESMSVIAGSRGYLAPEYAYTLRVNEKSDIYSFGVVILELVTGRKPVDDEGDLAAWVQTKVNQKEYDNVVDHELEYESKEQIYRVLEIGLSCISPVPLNRPSMRTVVKLLQEVTPDGKQKSTIHKDGKVSPYLEENDSDQASLC
uniref:receptor-like protein kinase HSL1 n=1 Tax=Erigeron canadensis TaxID=72917 RepID=UPI001CB91C0A|nr:receptor-like protein kinase HSL1 [Erigeron canadensis]